MNLKREELRRLALPLTVALALLGGGVALIWAANSALESAQRGLASARQERNENQARLSHIVEEEREVKAKLALYRRLQELNILGAERRLEWAEAIQRIRKRRDLLDVRYRVERQKLLTSVSGKPAPVNFYGSTLKVDLALLHEEDLLRFLEDLRASGNAYYSVQRCSVARTGKTAAARDIEPRLRADCEIELITIVDGAAKP